MNHKLTVHRAFRLVMAAILMASLLLPYSASASPPERQQASIEPRVLEQLAAQNETTFWVILREKADLRAAYTMQNWDARGRFVFERLQATAEASQARLRAWLQSRRVAYRPFWILNAIRVKADKATLAELAAMPEVAQIAADGAYQIPQPLPGKAQPGVQAVEWNIDRIRAPEVWSTFGVRGEGIFVVNIDTGVQFDHPALVAQYRGNLGGGVFDHNYNWFDPSNVCGSPSLVPCDNAGHGTHTMGTMVGDDGDPGPNQIGVAPHAKWGAAKGCESFSCSFSALLASGQWVLAPTDLNGQNPRPDLRPQVVNNSWGGGPGDPFYQSIVDAWVASGIFPAFSNGNSGPGCNSSGSPGDYVQTYSAGALDIFNNIAFFSSRGPSAFGSETKPNIAAPGVSVRSSVPFNGYDVFSGTSMASPHVAATVALMWSAAPTLVGDIASTRALLDQTAVDTPDLSCGGTDADNNVWGEGRLDAFAAVDLSPRGPTGTLQGAVTDANTGLPISGATIRAVGPTDRTTITDASGQYSMLLPVGTYDVTASAFGYIGQTATGVVVNEGATTVQNFALTPAPSHSVSGTVRDSGGNPVVNATVTILGTPISPATTDANGFYSFASVPDGEYDVRAEAGRCNGAQTQHLIVDGDKTLDFTLPQRSDGFGYTCQIVPFSFIDANTVLSLFGDDSATAVSLPFPFTLYGRTYSTAYVSTNGFLNFLGPNARFSNGPIPDFSEPNAALYPFWDDLYVDGAASVRTELLGSAPNRQFVIEWRDVAFCCISVERVRFEVVLFENGRILMQYTSIDANGREQGNSATVGIENADGTDAFQYSFDEAAISDGLAVHYSPPPSGFVEGHVTDAVDGTPLPGVNVAALEAGRVTTTDADGRYRMLLPLGTFTLEASANNYVTERATVTILDGQTTVQDFALRSARAQATPAALNFLAVAGRTRTQVLTLRNTGLADLTFTIGELSVPAAARITPPQVADTRTAPADYTPKSVASSLLGGPVLVFVDALPWGRDSLMQVLNANGIPFDTANSAQMSTIDMSQYEVVFISSDQPAGFYSNYNANVSRFSDYVQGGGFLWVGAAAWGFNGGDFNGGQLPGGATVRGPVFESFNDVIDNAHPTMQGVPNPFSGNYASHAAFENLPAGTNVIARGQSSGLPTLIEYEFGAGRVLAFGQTLEFYLGFGDPGRILENGVPYAYAFEPTLDIPWLSANPASGTVAPGAAQTIQVTVDTTSLAPGLYRARLVIRTNDPRNPSLQVPVTLIVPAYQQGVNAGSSAYTDLVGDLWAADQAYTAGSWGYLFKSKTINSRRGISGTNDDVLYQSARTGGHEYRFDGLAPGVYQVELRFAEIEGKKPFKRLYDVIVEGGLVLPAHDIAAEVGAYAADNHSFFVLVEDGQLSIRFIPRKGFGDPIINAIRVTHRPDR